MREVVSVNALHDPREPTVYCNDGTSFRYREHTGQYEQVITAQVPQPEPQPDNPAPAAQPEEPTLEASMLHG